MFKNIAFIGGIHGVGKSTICSEVCENLKLIHLSASEVLKWKEVEGADNAKEVKDIQHNQDRLITGLKLIVKEQNRYLLDGHFCLITSEGVIKKVPFETFKLINPTSLNLIIDDVVKIKDKLEKRDKKLYDLKLLSNMQESEIIYAKEVAERLQLQLNVGTNSNYSNILNALK